MRNEFWRPRGWLARVGLGVAMLLTFSGRRGLPSFAPDGYWRGWPALAGMSVMAIFLIAKLARGERPGDDAPITLDLTKPDDEA